VTGCDRLFDVNHLSRWSDSYQNWIKYCSSNETYTAQYQLL